MVWESWELCLWSQSWERNWDLLAACLCLSCLSIHFCNSELQGPCGYCKEQMEHPQCPAWAVMGRVRRDLGSPWGEPCRVLTCLSVLSWRNIETPRNRWSSCRRNRASWCKRKTTCAASIARPSWPAASLRACAVSCSAITVPSR